MTTKHIDYIAEEISQDHKTVHRCKETLKKLLAMPFSEVCQEQLLDDIQVLFCIFRGRLKLHFELEEMHGFKTLMEAQPWVEDKVKDIFAEHKTLLETIDHLAQLAKSLTQLEEPLFHQTAAEYHEFARNLDLHYETENSFILEVDNQDFGTKG